ncbi:MAG: trypsin-like peptidase domain-containing protein [Fimbriimonadales bacterium]
MNAFGKLLRSQFGWALIAGAAVGTAGTVAFLNTQRSALADTEISALGGQELSALATLDAAGTKLVEQVAPSVVLIRTGRGEGSGIIFRADGYVMTNAHVVAGVKDVSVVLHSGREEKGTVIRDADDSLNDIALIKINRTGLPAARFADSSTVKPGQIAVAIGAPFGLAESVSFGHVSALGRQNLVPDNELRSGVRGYFNMIQTDAAINPGNSGGPLLNYKGEVIGINSAINSMTGYNSGVGFAIPSNTAKIIADQLLKDGVISRSYLGVEPSDLKGYEVEELGIRSGAIIRRVEPKSPADVAGLNEGDIVIEIAKKPISGEQDLREAMLLTAPGKMIEVRAVRGGATKTFQVTPSKRPEVPVAQRRQQMPPGLGDDFPGVPMPPREIPRADEEPISGPVRLGVNVRAVDAQEKPGVSGGQGVVVVSVEPGSPAAKAGVTVGSIITQLGNDRITSPESLKKAISEYKHGDMVNITFAEIGPNRKKVSSVPLRF